MFTNLQQIIDKNSSILSRVSEHSSQNTSLNRGMVNGVSNVPFRPGQTDSYDDALKTALSVSLAATLQEESNLQQALAASKSTDDNDHYNADLKTAIFLSLAASKMTAIQERNKIGSITQTSDDNKATGTTQLETQAMAHFNAIPVLKEYLLENGYSVRDSSGENNNCLFYSIVQCVNHIVKISGDVAEKASRLRSIYDEKKPGSKGQGLFFDNNNAYGGNKGHAQYIVNLASELLEENIRVKVISSNLFDDKSPWIEEGDYVGRKSGKKTQLNIIILNTPNHYQSVVKIDASLQHDPFF